MVVGFLGILVLLLTQVPIQLYTAGEMRTVIIPTDWEGINLQNFEDTWNATTINSHFENFDIGGRNLNWESNYALDWAILTHRFGFLLLWEEAGTWYDRRGIIVSDSDGLPVNQQKLRSADLNADYSTNGDIQFTVRFEAEAVFQLSAIFTFNETLYSTPSDAWDSDALNVLVGIGFDQVNTTYNAWDLVGMLLFFRLPMINIILNGIIAIPIWVAIAYVSFILILRAIGAVFGGGGA